MPELIENGPVIPVELLNLLDDGKVVFFCGAGISVGTGLPNFKDLVDYVYEASHLQPDQIERDALDHEEIVEEKRHPQLDKVLGLLERENRLGSSNPSLQSRLRQIVVERLSRRSTGPLKVHRALLDLSKTSHGTRLVTTNFDNRFKSAGLSERWIDVSPRLPVPKFHDWHSLVHLHGRIVPPGLGKHLVLTAADFGRAYLTERWAARFITELFREFTVVFVGYSLDDPVMSYMVDALAAERSRGARFGKAFAFGGHNDDPGKRQRAIDGWHAKNVEPIPYDQRNGHKLLNDTLVEWARIKNDPFEARTQIALKGIGKIPDAATDPVAVRVAWALEDSVVARALAESSPVIDEADYVKIASWLDIFAEAGLLSRGAASSHKDGIEPMPLVDGGMLTQYPPNVDAVTWHFATWIARHLHVPNVLEWVVKKGGYLHRVLREEVRRHLPKPAVDVHERLRLIWTILAYRAPHDVTETLWLSDQYKKATSDEERAVLAQQAVSSIRPRLKVLPGPSSRIQFARLIEKRDTPVPAVEGCAHLELAVFDSDLSHGVEAIIARREVLAGHAEELTGYLEAALDLSVMDDESERISYYYRPSIAQHAQNEHRPDWTILIDWVRDSYFALLEIDRKRAGSLLGRWATSRRKLLRRLALNAITDDQKSDIRVAEKILLSGRKRGLWDPELRREVLRFLRKAGARLPHASRSSLIAAIRSGPGIGRARQTQHDAWRRESGLRYYKLHEAGVRLPKAAQNLADEFAPDAENISEHRDEFLSWSGGARWISPEERAPQEFLAKPFRQLTTALQEAEFSAEGLEGLTISQPEKCTWALRLLGKNGFWPAKHWQRFLWATSSLRRQEKLSPRLERFIAAVLTRAPDKLFSEVGAAVGDFVEEASKIYSPDCEPMIKELWDKAWGGIGPMPQTDSDDVLTQALNNVAGKLAEAALHRLWKYEPKANGGLPAPTLNYFDAIASDPNGHLGRVMLTTRLYQLFALDPDWTSANLLPRLTDINSSEAVDLWTAYGWSPTVGPNLLAAFKGAFLEMLRRHERLGRREDNLIALFISICLEAPNSLTPEEIRSVVERLPEDALVTILHQLREWLKPSIGKPEETWLRKIAPWLKAYWPISSERNTSRTSEALVRLLFETGSAFPDAASWALDYLRPLNERGLYAVKKSSLPRDYPGSVLDVLKRLVSDGSLSSWEKAALKEILDAILQGAPRYRSDLDFQQLYRIATH